MPATAPAGPVPVLGRRSAGRWGPGDPKGVPRWIGRRGPGNPRGQGGPEGPRWIRRRRDEPGRSGADERSGRGRRPAGGRGAGVHGRPGAALGRRGRRQGRPGGRRRRRTRRRRAPRPGDQGAAAAWRPGPARLPRRPRPSLHRRPGTAGMRPPRGRAGRLPGGRRPLRRRPSRRALGWVMDAFPGGTPHRAALDAVVGDRPVFLASTDGHSAWVNSRALAVAGVTAATPDPPRGRIERDAAGEPTGALHEEAMNLVGDLVPDPGPAQREAGIELGQAHLHRLGVTAWQDALVSPETLAAYRAVAERGALTGRVVAAVKWEVADGDAQLATLPELTRTHTVGRLRATAVKHFQDGGFDVHVHAIGDRAVREALDAFQAAADANGRRDSRHQIAHLQFVHPDDRPRFRRLGVVANAQPFWACLDGYMRKLTLPFLDPERAGWQYPWASLRRAGAVLAFGSDWTVSTANPLLELEVAVNRVAPGDRGGEPFLPEERLDLPAALDAFTIGSAYALRLEADTGSIEPGKLADLAVLDRDPFDPAAGPIGDARVLATLIEGEPVHADPDLDLAG